jgi:Tol biopolymer transport system component
MVVHWNLSLVRQMVYTKTFNKTLLFLIAALIPFLSSIDSFAQFGKNKVQYQTFDWKFIESEHFKVYFDAGSDYLARFAAIEAEKSLFEIASLLNFKVNKQIPFVVYDSHNQFQQTNVTWSTLPEGVGGFTEMAKNRIVVPFEGDWEKFRHVIHHELIHGYLNQMFFGGTLQSSVRSGQRIQFPLWMNEGLAEFSSQFGFDTQTDVFMRDVTLSEELKGLDYLNGYYAYRGGQAFYWYVAKTYGVERVGDLINNLKILRTVDKAFIQTFGINYEDFSEKWVRELKKYYLPDIEKFVDPQDFAERITDAKDDNTFYNTSPAVSPDGEKLAYISAPGRNFGIYIKNLNKRGLKEDARNVVQSARQQDFEDLNILTPGISWNPQSTQIAVSAKAGGEDAIFLIDVESEDYEKIAFGISQISSVTWSPDGNFLAFSGSENQQSDIYIYDIKYKSLTNLTDDVFSDVIPSWSADSKTIYFISDRGDNIAGDLSKEEIKIWNYDFNNSDIYSVGVKSKEISRITFDPQFSKTSIAATPDDKSILYVSDKNGIGNIYEMNFNTGNSRPLTNSLKGISQVSMSSDASILVFATLIDGAYDLFMLRHPLDEDLDLDSLPLTKYRKRENEKIALISNMANAENETSSFEDNTIVGYGDFEIDFSRQEAVSPNPAARIQDDDALLNSNLDNNLVDGDFEIQDYKIKISTDIIFANPGVSSYYGVMGTTQMLFSDDLGDHQIYLGVNFLLDLRNSSGVLTYSYLPEIVDYHFSIFQSAGFVRGLTGDPTWRERGRRNTYRFRNWGASISAANAFDSHKRIEWGINWYNVSKDFLGVLTEYPSPEDPMYEEYLEYIDTYQEPDKSRMMFVPEASYVFDNTGYGYLGITSGSRYRINFKGTPKFSDNGIGFLNLEGDFRHYVPLTDFMNIALRFSGGKSFGPDPTPYYLGGVENWFNSSALYGSFPLEEPEDFAFMNFVMPLRGFNIGEIQGTQYFVVNAEYRFPLFMALMGPLPIMLTNIQGAAFLDMGGAWNGSFSNFKSTETIIIDGETRTIPRDLVMSMGVGIRTSLIGMPFKIDVAWVNLIHNWSEPRWMFSLGYGF